MTMLPPWYLLLSAFGLLAAGSPSTAQQTAAEQGAGGEASAPAEAATACMDFDQPPASSETAATPEGSAETPFMTQNGITAVAAAFRPEPADRPGAGTVSLAPGGPLGGHDQRSLALNATGVLLDFSGVGFPVGEVTFDFFSYLDYAPLEIEVITQTAVVPLGAFEGGTLSMSGTEVEYRLSQTRGGPRGSVTVRGPIRGLRLGSANERLVIDNICASGYGDATESGAVGEAGRADPDR